MEVIMRDYNVGQEIDMWNHHTGVVISKFMSMGEWVYDIRIDDKQNQVFTQEQLNDSLK